MRILVTCLVLVAVAPAFAVDQTVQPRVEEGTIGNAAFRIDIPSGWKGSGLVMYAHGYAVVTDTPAFQVDFVKAASTLGFAVAQSRYSRQGWAAREGILETEALRQYFVEKYGRPSMTIISGHSQGGAITYATIEKFPEAYDGALPLCAAAPSALEFFKLRAFDLRVLFDYYFPGLNGSATEFPDGPATLPMVREKAKALITPDPGKAAAFARMTTLSSVDVIPEVIGFFSEILRELNERAGGNPFNNTNTIYSGSTDDAALNRGIQRFESNGDAEQYLRQWVTHTGEISDPVLSLHTLVDDLVPPVIANQYGLMTIRRGTSNLYLQRWIDRAGHCAISVDETTEGLRLLSAWIRTGKRPAPDNGLQPQ